MDHIGRRLATATLLLGICCQAPLDAWGQALPPLTPAQAPAPQGYSQAGITAEATADNAVLAREQGLALANRQAYARLAAELGLPPASDAQIDRMIESVVVEEERTSRTGYTGRLTVNFNPGRVQAFASRGGGAAAAAPTASPAATFLEVTTGYGGMVEWLEVRRRLLASPAIAQVDVLAISIDQARLRLGLRAPPAQVVLDLAPAGVTLTAPSRPGEGWRLGLAGRG